MYKSNRPANKKVVKSPKKAKYITTPTGLDIQAKRWLVRDL